MFKRSLAWSVSLEANPKLTMSVTGFWKWHPKLICATFLLCTYIRSLISPYG